MTQFEIRDRKAWRNLSLIALFLFIITYLYQGFITLGSTSCGFIARLRGSGCLRVIERHTDFGASDVFFTNDAQSIIFADGFGYKVGSVDFNLLFGDKYVYLDGLLHKNGITNEHQSTLDAFEISNDQNLVSICVTFYFPGSKFIERVFLTNSTQTMFEDLKLENDFFCLFSTIKFSPDSKTMVIGDLYRKSTIIDLKTKTKKVVAGWGFDFSPDNRYIAGCTQKPDSLMVYEFPGLIPKYQFMLKKECRFVIFSPDSKRIFIAPNEDKIRVFNVESGQEEEPFSSPFPSLDLTSIAISPDGASLVGGFDGIDDKAYVLIWNISTRRLYKSIILDGSIKFTPRSLRFSPDGNLLAIGTTRYLMIFDVSTE
jgi:WD40 repeat protein